MSYDHPNDNNLKNLHKAMSYNAAGEPVVRTHVDGISLQGDVIVDTVSLSTATLAALETVNIGNIPEVEIKNDSGNPISITGNVTATITDVVTVAINEDAGELFAFNNHATAVHRGWVMDDVMRPMVSVRINPATTTSATLMKIVEYELGNNNANQSTIMYEWYEGDLNFSGAAVPGWTSVNGSSQYRIYQDVYSSNQGNTFTVPAGTYMRHSGIIIGKNSDGDEIEKPLRGGNTGKMLTLCMKRLDNSTKLDVWFSFTLKEIT